MRRPYADRVRAGKEFSDQASRGFMGTFCLMISSLINKGQLTIRIIAKN